MISVLNNLNYQSAVHTTPQELEDAIKKQRLHHIQEDQVIEKVQEKEMVGQE